MLMSLVCGMSSYRETCVFAKLTLTPSQTLPGPHFHSPKHRWIFTEASDKETHIEALVCVFSSGDASFLYPPLCSPYIFLSEVHVLWAFSVDIPTAECSSLMHTAWVLILLLLLLSYRFGESTIITLHH